MAVSTNQFKNGMCILRNGKRWIIVEFQHVKPGKGGAFVRTKLKELESGKVVDVTFNAGEKVDDVRVETRRMQFLYSDAGAHHFMDNDSYEQVELGADFVGGAARWIKEGDEVQVLTADGEMIGVEAPMFVELGVTSTEPGFKGDTVQGGTKPATLETGAVVQVPMYVDAGERVQIDTRDGRFVKRV